MSPPPPSTTTLFPIYPTGEYGKTTSVPDNNALSSTYYIFHSYYARFIGDCRNGRKTLSPVLSRSHKKCTVLIIKLTSVSFRLEVYGFFLFWVHEPHLFPLGLPVSWPPRPAASAGGDRRTSQEKEEEEEEEPSSAHLQQQKKTL